jgi:hypothetical protein
MQETNTDKQSKLIPVLREGVGLVQMVLYKEVRRHLHKHSNTAPETDLATLAGTITNEIFGTPNMADRFRQFREQNHGTIEQEMLSLSDYLGDFCDILTDALRIQTLCDHQENGTESSVLLRARELGILREEREIPLPSSFITRVRELGEAHGLIIAPLQAD